MKKTTNERKTKLEHIKYVESELQNILIEKGRDLSLGVMNSLIKSRGTKEMSEIFIRLFDRYNKIKVQREFLEKNNV